MLFYLNTDIWNNTKIYKLSNYCIEELTESLIALSKFVSENLVPNKLKYFDLEAIKHIKNSKDVQSIINAVVNVNQNKENEKKD